MGGAKRKTEPTEQPVDAAVAAIDDEVQRTEARELVSLFERATGEPAVLWGSSIVGFGRGMLRYADGSEREWMRVGFAPRKGTFALYLTGDASAYADELAELGRTRSGKGCIYVRRLGDVDLDRLEAFIARRYAESAAD